MPMPEVPSRRGFIASGLAAAAFAAAPLRAQRRAVTVPVVIPPAITPAERLSRVAKAQSLMRAAGIGALLIEPGASLSYFTGVRWNRSERLTAAVIPATGDAFVVTPFFEEPSVRESLAIPAKILTWQEDENPLGLVAARLTASGFGRLPLALEETVRFFVQDGLGPRSQIVTLEEAARRFEEPLVPRFDIVSGAPVVRALRMIKSPAEIALMQAAADVTMAAYRDTYPRIRAGMSPADIGALMKSATESLGGRHEFALVLLGEASAYPHGSGKPQAVRSGEVVLMDCGCTVHGYQSDISRSFVFGTPSPKQRKVWNDMRRGQDIAFAAARIGTPAGKVDDAVRADYVARGYGPGYKLPGLSHRTGHGIGMDGHEPVNLVHGETTPLAPGMCFSNEPGIYIPGEFGIRLEDCFHMTAGGPRWFSQPSPSIERPFG